MSHLEPCPVVSHGQTQTGFAGPETCYFLTSRGFFTAGAGMSMSPAFASAPA